MSKEIFYDQEAREKVIAGAKKMADAVKVTMGAKGRNVMIKKSFGAPILTHDGVTVAENINLASDDIHSQALDAGAELIKQAAKKMNAVAGDGTTTVTVLTYEMLAEAHRLIAAGYNPMELRVGVEEAGAEVIAKLEKMAEKIEGNKAKIVEVATISAADKKIGELVGDVIESVGTTGVVTVEQGEGLDMKKEIIEGFSFDRGFVSGLMVTDVNRLEAKLEAPKIIITDKRLSNAMEIVSFFTELMKKQIKNIVLVAEEIESDALEFLLRNNQRGIFKVVAVRAPSFGEQRKNILEDLAILTGGKVISDGNDLSFSTATVDVLGDARRVLITKDTTTVIQGSGDAKAVEDRIKAITDQSKTDVTEFEKERLKKRAAALGGKVAVIKIGGATEQEIEEKKFRVDDAVAAARAALSEGIVPGGGVTLVNLSDQLKDKGIPGRAIVKKALLKPFLQLMENAGLNGAALLKDVQRAEKGMGVNVMGGEDLIDMKAHGVVDPVLVTKLAIQNAVSIAGTGMTMGALIVDVPVKRSAGYDDDPMNEMGLD